MTAPFPSLRAAHELEPAPLARNALRALLLGVGALLGSAAACSDEPAAPPVTAPDAGPPCERGTQGCACFFGSGCVDDLLCIAGRCLENQGSNRSEPRPMSHPQIVPELPDRQPSPSGGAPDASAGGETPLDGGGADAAADGG